MVIPPSTVNALRNVRVRLPISTDDISRNLRINQTGVDRVDANSMVDVFESRCPSYLRGWHKQTPYAKPTEFVFP
jgi:hypothetical protein